MSKQPSPRKKPRRRRLSVNVRDRWEKIVKGVKKSDVPVSVLESLTVNLIDGTKVKVDIQALVNSGASHDDIETLLNEKLSELDQYIDDVDFYVNVDEVAKVIQPVTDSFLKDL